MGIYTFQGKDPSFQYENAIEIAEALNKVGVRQINGDLIVLLIDLLWALTAQPNGQLNHYFQL